MISPCCHHLKWARGGTHVTCFSDLPNCGQIKFTSHLIFTVEHIYFTLRLIHLSLIKIYLLIFRPITFIRKYISSLFNIITTWRRLFISAVTSIRPWMMLSPQAIFGKATQNTRKHESHSRLCECRYTKSASYQWCSEAWMFINFYQLFPGPYT